MSKKISELTETIEPQDSDVLAIVNESETKKVTLANIIAKIKTALNSMYAAITHTHVKADITDLEIPTKVSELENDSGFLNSETDPSVPSHVKNITEADIQNWNNPSGYTLPTASADTLGGVKVGAGLSITNGVLSATGGGVADSVEWANIQNKPSTFTPSTHTHTKNEITDFPTIPSKTSELENDSGYITGYTAGENITIENGVISASGGGGGGDTRTLIASGTSREQTITIPSGYDKIIIELNALAVCRIRLNGSNFILYRNKYIGLNSSTDQNPYELVTGSNVSLAGGMYYDKGYFKGKIEINFNTGAIHSCIYADVKTSADKGFYIENGIYETLTSIELPQATWNMYGIKYSS